MEPLILHYIDAIRKTSPGGDSDIQIHPQGHTDCVYSVHFDGKGLLASGSWDNSIQLWDVSTGNCLKTLKGHISRVNIVNFDGKGLLASGSRDNSIRLWEASSGNCLKTLSKD
jgi:WD40 repeat protein